MCGLIVYAVLGIAAVLWLLLLSILLGWPGFIGMACLLTGIAITVFRMNTALFTRRLPSRADASAIGVLLIFAGVIGLIWGLVATIA